MPDQASTPVSGGSDRVEVSVPLRTEYFATLRTVAAALGADAGFSVDEIDDLRLAISEVVASVAAGAGSPDDRIIVTFHLDGTEVRVTITTQNHDLGIELDQLASSILDSVVDRYDVDGTQVTLVKLGSEAAAPASDVERATSQA